jgi:hypothetical protein
MINVRASVSLWMVAALVASTAAAQSPLDEGPRRGFDVAIVPSFSLGFNGIRAWSIDSITCNTRPDRCVSYAEGKGPMIGTDLQVPLGRYFGLSVGGAIGRPVQTLCVQGSDCRIADRVTLIKGNGLLLFRLKPQAPVFFGIGYGGSYASPGPVPNQSAQTEKGPVLEVAFDFALGKQVGLRLAWWNYWLQTTGADELPFRVVPETTAHDALLSFGARVRIPK